MPLHDVRGGLTLKPGIRSWRAFSAPCSSAASCVHKCTCSASLLLTTAAILATWRCSWPWCTGGRLERSSHLARPRRTCPVCSRSTIAAHHFHTWQQSFRYESTSSPCALLALSRSCWTCFFLLLCVLRGIAPLSVGIVLAVVDLDQDAALIGMRLRQFSVASDNIPVDWVLADVIHKAQYHEMHDQHEQRAERPLHGLVNVTALDSNKGVSKPTFVVVTTTDQIHVRHHTAKTRAHSECDSNTLEQASPPSVVQNFVLCFRLPIRGNCVARWLKRLFGPVRQHVRPFL